MPKTIFTLKQANYIKQNRLTISCNKMSAKLGISRTSIKTFLKDNGLLLTPEESKKLKSDSAKEKTTFTKKDDAFIKQNYLSMPVKVMAKKINRSYCGVIGRIEKLGLIIPEEIIEQRKQNSRFVPGHVSFNKGLKQSDFMTPEAIEKTKKNRFKKGNLPHNTASFDGIIRIRKDSGGRRYKWIRISVGVWKMLHVHLWEQNNGQIPAGHIITFKDKNSLNVELNNLQLVTLAENMLNNTIHNYPAEIKEIMILKGAIKSAITRNLKKKNHDRPD